MTHVPEELLALYAGGDLEAKELRRIGGHLESCGECRDLLAEFQENLRVLEIRPVEPTADELLVLRKGVIQQLQRRRKSAVVRLGWAAASIAAAAVITIAILFGGKPPRSNAIQHPSLATTAHLHVPYRAVVEISIPNLGAEIVRTRRGPQRDAAGIRKVSLLAEQDGPRILKVTTADPNVVILWQVTKGQEEVHD